MMNSVLDFGFDFTAEVQAWGFLRISALSPYAPRQARICSTHAFPDTPVRADAFTKMKARIASLPAAGVCAPFSQPFPQPPLADGVRADIEVDSGEAFID